MVRIAIPVWEGRISPLLDEAREFIVAEIDGETIVNRYRLANPLPCPSRLVLIMRDANVGTIVCGAVSHQLQVRLSRCGIRTIPFRKGCIEAALDAFARGRLDDPEFTLCGNSCLKRADSAGATKCPKRHSRGSLGPRRAGSLPTRNRR